MSGIITDISSTVLINVLQIVAGCLLSIPAYSLAKALSVKQQRGYITDMFFILAASLLGLSLPLGTYGMIPLIAVAAAAGVRIYIIMPVLISSIIFNMAVTFADSTFVWNKAVLGRMSLAFAVGILSGIILKSIKVNEDTLLRRKDLDKLIVTSKGISGITGTLGASINIMGIYLLIGVVAATLFQRYMFVDVLGAVYASSAGASFAKFLVGHNATTNVFFGLAVVIINIFMDLLKWSALFLIFKIKGIAAYIIYYSAWTLMLIMLFLLV
ncbi:MAG: hypothetical protein N3B21_04915 [Clostridia bacterium]|nr:hypothetical protein [Clostridia bacterium]